MPKQKYRYNPHTLSFEVENRGGTNRLKRWARYVTVSLLLTAIMTTIGYFTFDSAKNIELKRENRRILAQYNLLKDDINNLNGVLNDISKRDNDIYRVIFETEPIPSSVRDAGFGGVNRYNHLEDLTNSELIIDVSKQVDILAKKMYVQTKSYDEVLKLALSKEKMIAHIPSIRPLVDGRVISGYCYRMHPIYKRRIFHYGIDFTASTGTEVFATGNGVVTDVKKLRTGWGNHIVINHGYSYKTLYAHLSGFNVKKGDKIKRGDLIGFTGSTGTSSGPHLHYEVRKNNSPVNPLAYFINDLSMVEYKEMISSLAERELLEFDDTETSANVDKTIP